MAQIFFLRRKETARALDIKIRHMFLRYFIPSWEVNLEISHVSLTIASR